MTTAPLRRVRRAVVAALSAAALGLGVASMGVQAYAAVASVVPEGLPGARAAAAGPGDLAVEAFPGAAYFTDLTPGDRRYWPLRAELHGAPSGSFALRVHGSGGLVEHANHGLTIAVHSCTGGYVGNDPAVEPTCSGASRTVFDERPLAEISSQPTADHTQHTWVLPDILRSQARHFLVVLGVPGEGALDESLMGLSGEFGIGLYAAGDAPVTPDDPIPGDPVPGTDPTPGTDPAPGPTTVPGPEPQPTSDPTGPARPPTGQVPRPAPAVPAAPGEQPTTSAQPSTGTLPDTGGPVLALVLTGAGAVGLGATFAGRGRRRP